MPRVTSTEKDDRRQSQLPVHPMGTWGQLQMLAFSFISLGTGACKLGTKDAALCTLSLRPIAPQFKINASIFGEQFEWG